MKFRDKKSTTNLEVNKIYKVTGSSGKISPDCFCGTVKFLRYYDNTKKVAICKSLTCWNNFKSCCNYSETIFHLSSFKFTLLD